MNPRPSRGFTLIEVVVTLTIILVVLGFVTLRHKPSPVATVRDTAAAMVADLQEAKAQAVATAGKAIFRFERSGGPQGNGWWAAWRADADDTNTTPAPGSILPLENDVIFGSGHAVYGPMGDPVNSLEPTPLSVVTCDAFGRCELGDKIVVTYYLQHRDRPDAVAAVTIGRSGTIRAWHFNPENGSWK